MMGRLIIYCPPYQEINFTALLKKKKLDYLVEISVR